MGFTSTQDRSSQDVARRWAILTGVGVLHLGAFYGLVVGLAGVVRIIEPPRNLVAHDDRFFVPALPPTAQPKPRPHPDTSRLVIRDTNVTTVPLQDLPPLALPSSDAESIGEGPSVQGSGDLPPLPKSPLRFESRPAKPRGMPGAWISTEDYPAQDLREGNGGMTGFRLVIGRDGQPQSCTITVSSGHPGLDHTTCQLVSRRARFNAATDDTGATVLGSYQGKVYWTIPDR